MQTEEKMSLPTFVMFKSKFLKRYLRLCSKEIGSLTDNFLSFDEEEPLKPREKFEVVPATTVGGGLVHIKSTENGKYWVLGPVIPDPEVPISDPDSCVRWILAAADQPEEDTGRPSCTLFRPIFLKDETQQKIRLANVHLGRLVHIMSGGGYADSCLVTGGRRIEEEASNVFTVIDWDSFVVPQYAAFKGVDGLYLRARTLQQETYLQFSTNKISDPGVMNHLIKYDGHICIRNTSYNKYWRRASDWIWADTVDYIDNPDTHFEIVKYADGAKEVALRNLGNNCYCKRTTAAGYPHDVLSADSDTPFLMEMEPLPSP